MRLYSRGKGSDLEFFADSAEQIAESIDRTGLRDDLEQAFQAAIARARGSQQESAQPALDETREVDLGNDASQKGRTTSVES